MGLARELVERMKEELEQKKVSRKAILNRLALLDADLDMMDELIISLDKKSSDMINIINTKIDAVRDAYNARIEANCKSGLVWKSIEIINYGPFQYTSYEATKDTNSEDIIPYYGLKYIQKPLDRDYGSTIVSQFSGDVENGKPIIIVTSQNGVSPNINVGDIITDSISSPQVFIESDLPTVVGFGTTEGISPVEVLVGGISTNSNVFYHFGSGDYDLVELGMNFTLPNTNIIPNSTEVVGFGTGNWPIEYFDENGDLQVSQLSVNTILLSNPATDYIEESKFYVGIVTSYPTIMLSTSATTNKTNVPFIALNTDENIDVNFDYTSNPNSPIKIGILQSSELGIGGSISLDNSGESPETKVFNVGSTYVDPTLKETKCLLRSDSRWENNQCVINPEPIVGSGRPEYSIGTDYWPIIKSGIAPYYVTKYAEEGDIVRSSGTIDFGYTQIPPFPQPSPSECSNLTQQINAALAEYELEKSKYEGKIQEYSQVSQALRIEREKVQLYAWSLLQGSSKLLEEITQTESFISKIDSFDFEELN